MTRTPTAAETQSISSPKESPLIVWADAVSPDESPLIRWPRRIVRILLICWKELKENVLTIRAGYLTYAILLSMVPMLAMSTALVKGLGGGDQLREVVYAYVDSLEQSSAGGTRQTDSMVHPEVQTEVRPEAQTGPPKEIQKGKPEDLVGHLRSAVEQVFDYVDRTNFATLGTFGMVGILFSVIMVLGQVEKSLNVIWKVKDGRSILRKVADYLALMILMPISLNVALAAGTMLKSQSLNVHVDQFLPIAWIQELLLKGIPVLVLSFTLYIVYIFFPNTKTTGKATMIGALIAGTGWFLTQNVYIGMQIGVSKYNAIYGSFATIPLFLAWVWVGCMFVLIGAQIAYAIQTEPRYRFIPGTVRPVQQISAALDICSLIGRRFGKMEPTFRSDIFEQCPDYNQEILEEVLTRLVENNIIHYTLQTDEIMPSRPPELLTSRNIVETVLGRDMPDTTGGKTTLQAMTGMVDSFPDDRESEVDDAPVSEDSSDHQTPDKPGEDCASGNRRDRASG